MVFITKKKMEKKKKKNWEEGEQKQSMCENTMNTLLYILV